MGDNKNQGLTAGASLQRVHFKAAASPARWKSSTCPQARARDSSNVAFLLAADKPIMETLSHLSTPAMNTHDHRRDSTMTSDQFLKMEDLHSSASPSPSFDPQDASPAPDASQASPAPVIVQSKPAKKRKSWGQELPEPKTHLPPRKRAKTDDEKEQRRIERIKRNRAAAHNSRERKRQETETLAVALARANAELEAYRRLHGPLPANIQLPDVQLSSDMYVALALPPSLPCFIT